MLEICLHYDMTKDRPAKPIQTECEDCGYRLGEWRWHEKGRVWAGLCSNCGEKAVVYSGEADAVQKNHQARQGMDELIGRGLPNQKDAWDIIEWTTGCPRFEPEERLHDTREHHAHRFPIIGGISLAELTAKQLMKPSPFLELLEKRGRIIRKHEGVSDKSITWPVYTEKQQ